MKIINDWLKDLLNSILNGVSTTNTTLNAFKIENNINLENIDDELVNVNSNLGVIDTSINAFKTTNTSENGTINSNLVTIDNSIQSLKTTNTSENGVIDTSINAFKTQNNSNLGVIDTDLNTFRSQNNSNLGILNGDLNTFKTTNSSENGTINSNLGVIDTSINAFKTSNTSENGTINTSITTLNSDNTTQNATLNTSINALKTSNTSENGTIDNSIQSLKTSNTSENNAINALLELIRQKGSYSIFNEQIGVQYTPIIQNTPSSRIIRNTLFTIYKLGTGNVKLDLLNGDFVFTTATSGDFVVLRSKRCLKYRPGFSNNVNGGVKFSTPQTGLYQFFGVSNLCSFIYLGYYNSLFGFSYGTQGLLQSLTLTITTASNNAGTANLTLNGTLYAIPITNAGGNTSFTAFEIQRFFDGNLDWLVSNENNIVYILARKAETRAGANTFTDTNATVGVLSVVVTGQAFTTTFIPYSSRNGETYPTTLDPLKYNMYRIEYAWYGASAFKFQVLSPSEERYITLHTFRFTNTQNSVSLNYPNMYLSKGVQSISYVGAVEMRAGGSYGATSGSIRRIEPQIGIGIEKAVPANVETVMVAMKHRTCQFNHPVQSEILFGYLTLSATGTRNVLFKIIRYPATLGLNTTANFQSWRPATSESILLIDDVVDTYTGGEVALSISIPAAGNQVMNLIDNGIYLAQNDIFIITAFSTNATTALVSLQLLEDI